MAQSQSRQGIPTYLTLEQFKELLLPHLLMMSPLLTPSPPTKAPASASSSNTYLLQHTTAQPT